jgi:hypothetical protein
MIRVFIVHIVLTTIITFIILTQATHAAMPFAAGAALIGLDFLLLGIAWSWIFNKKLIALAVSLIVFKYAILGLIIYRLIKVLAVDPFWFSMGVASFILSALIYALWMNYSRP